MSKIYEGLAFTKFILMQKLMDTSVTVSNPCMFDNADKKWVATVVNLPSRLTIPRAKQTGLV
jgi:hypothetical protein